MGELLDYFVKQFRLSLAALKTNCLQIYAPAMMGALQCLKSTIENHLFSLPDASALKVTVSIGFAPCADNSKNSFAHAASLADAAMYAAKAMGGNAVHAARKPL